MTKFTDDVVADAGHVKATLQWIGEHWKSLGLAALTVVAIVLLVKLA